MKGILFKPDMVQAIVEGRKTQTRRVINPQPKIHTVASGITHGSWKQKPSCTILWSCQPNISRILNDIAQYARYQVGETVYIKEPVVIYDDGSDWLVSFDGGIDRVVYPPDEWISKHTVEGYKEYQKMFMPAWAARYFIKITSIIPQRLQDITP